MILKAVVVVDVSDSVGLAMKKTGFTISHTSTGMRVKIGGRLVPLDKTRVDMVSSGITDINCGCPCTTEKHNDASTGQERKA